MVHHVRLVELDYTKKIEELGPFGHGGRRMQKNEH